MTPCACSLVSQPLYLLTTPDSEFVRLFACLYCLPAARSASVPLRRRKNLLPLFASKSSGGLALDLACCKLESFPLYALVRVVSPEEGLKFACTGACVCAWLIGEINELASERGSVSLPTINDENDDNNDNNYCTEIMLSS